MSDAGATPLGPGVVGPDGILRPPAPNPSTVFPPSTPPTFPTAPPKQPD